MRPKNMYAACMVQPSRFALLAFTSLVCFALMGSSACGSDTNRHSGAGSADPGPEGQGSSPPGSGGSGSADPGSGSHDPGSGGTQALQGLNCYGTDNGGPTVCSTQMCEDGFGQAPCDTCWSNGTMPPHCTAGCDSSSIGENHGSLVCVTCDSQDDCPTGSCVVGNEMSTDNPMSLHFMTSCKSPPFNGDTLVCTADSDCGNGEKCMAVWPPKAGMSWPVTIKTCVSTG